MPANKPIEPPGALSVAALARWASVNRASLNQEIREGRLGAVHFRGRILIPYREAERWLASLPRALPSNKK